MNGETEVEHVEVEVEAEGTTEGEAKDVELTSQAEHIEVEAEHVEVEVEAEGTTEGEAKDVELTSQAEHIEVEAEHVEVEHVEAEAECTTDTEQMEIEAGFNKIIHDFATDILVTFPELKEAFTDATISIVNGEGSESDFTELKEHCLSIFPERFFDILYQNESLFESDTALELLPNVDFRALWRENISDNTRQTMWKYLQLILFTIVSDMSDTESFGDSAKLFEAINEETFKEKLEETISGMQECFDTEGDDMPDPTNIHEHISGMLDGKLGQFAREIAEETAEEMDVNVENANSVGDVFQKLVKDPTNLMNLVKKVGTRLDDKLKTGDLKESELMAEASEMLNKMKDMPGMGNFQQMFGQAAGGKMNFRAMQSKLNQNMQRAKQRERMQQRAAQRQTETFATRQSAADLEEATRKADAMMDAILRSEGIGADGTEKLVFSTGETYEKSTKKKRRKKKKNKNA